MKKIIDSLNTLLNKITYNSNGYLLLELELISFINDEENQISSREINQIISREIIAVDTKIDVNEMLHEDNTNQIYKMCDEFINIRINNSFVNASKDEKLTAANHWKKFVDFVEQDNVHEFMTIVKNAIPQVASNQNILFVTANESTKIVGNSKLFAIESKFNSKYNTNYKMIFITKEDWKKFYSTYSKDKVYEYQDESEFVNDDKNTITLAENIFGNEKINIE